MVRGFNKARLAEDFWVGKMATDGHSATAGGASFATLTAAPKYYDAFPADGVGDLKPLTLPTALVLTPDQVGDNIASSSTITVGTGSIISTIDTIGDQDFFAVELVAGHTYDIGQYMRTGGPSGVPLTDAYLELYDAAGNLVTTADGGGPNTQSGLDALLTFVADQSGTFYINARSFDQDPTNGTTGDAIGDYDLFVNDVTGTPTYVPYYDVDSPLHSIDWGSQVDRTSRNPDGEEGPRITGNAFTGVGANPYGIEGKNVITVYFAKAGDIFVSEDPTNPGATENMIAKGLEQWEKDAFLAAFHVYENVADLVFVEVDNRAAADFKIITYLGTPGAGASLLGRMSPPNEQNEGQAEFNAGDVRWTEAGLQPGGFYFPTLLHELGHGLGMAHPHDDGGRSSIMRGAGGGTGGIGGGLGDFDLSQQVFTVMSYNDGWQTSPYGQPRSGGLTGTEVDHFGWVGTLSPLDIAVIQDKYGVNEDIATGNDTYTLADASGPGVFHQAIWDAGGIDQILYAGGRDATIDLRAATLAYEEGGGGRVSYADGVFGGFTIANGVTIENASSGSGNDNLFGNGAANRLAAGDGADHLDGGAGSDVLVGGRGSDVLTGGLGADTFLFESIGDSQAGPGRDHITDFAKGSDVIDLTLIDASRFIGSGLFSGRTGEVRYAAFDGGTIIEVDTNGDRLADFQVELDNMVALSITDFRGVETDASGRGGGGSTKKGSTIFMANADEGNFQQSHDNHHMFASADMWTAPTDSLFY
jgi:Ca2+-binding RTX toxin-like protein